MERHKCKLCSRSFPNGRALGGHMKAHLATLPLPPKQPQQQTFNDSSSFSYSSESEEKSLIHELRENPKRSSRVADPEEVVAMVQDRESETESKNPTRQQRSKRNRKSNIVMSFMLSPTTLTTEPEPASSVSDTSPEEDVAMCLMMLSRDKWNRDNNAASSKGCCNREIKFKRVRGKHLCHGCGKTFRSSRALASHTSVCSNSQEGKNNNININNNINSINNNSKSKVFECPFCNKVFGSGQALGGHKRSHLIPSSSTANDSLSPKLKESFIDLNLPAPAEEDDLSVVSDA
ncbi:hypothetical protein RJT34_33557 [Clitoria ternatea]|uniref:C2H2-type domain-containing protein n=1 Tax=Clitoria ternatea TaxID=43366 RepID=A0AAN9EYE3_CLITE